MAHTEERAAAPRGETMPITMAHADIFLEWHEILMAFDDFAEDLASAEPLRAALAESLARATELKARQEHYAALKQQATKELNEEIDTGRERARRVRSIVKGVMGTENERLVQFKVAPRRPHGPRKKATEEAAPVPEEPSEE
jgi:hypothetical protein